MGLKVRFFINPLTKPYTSIVSQFITCSVFLASHPKEKIYSLTFLTRQSFGACLKLLCTKPTLLKNPLLTKCSKYSADVDVPFLVILP